MPKANGGTGPVVSYSSLGHGLGAVSFWAGIKVIAVWSGLLFLSLAVHGQQGSLPAGSGSISGRVKIGKDPAVGVPVVAQRELRGEPIVMEPTSVQTVTDSQGSYSLSGLKAGSYTVQLFAAGFVNAADLPLSDWGKTRPEKTVHLDEGDHLTDVDFSLAPEGVITGRITDTEGWSVTGKQVHLTPEREKQQVVLHYSSSMLTDERGIYRLFGVPPGRYRVSVGEVSSDGGPSISRPMDPQMPVTYYPGVPSTSQATAVEVAEGRETSGIDFKAARFLRGYHVSGFMQEADSGQPVPNLRFMISRSDENGRRGGTFSAGLGGANGEFEQGDLLPGKYSLALGPLDEASYNADPVDFEIFDQDLKGLILRLRRGDADISGQVILEGVEPAEAAAKMRTLELRAELLQHSVGMWKTTALAADGTFTFRGLPSGKVTFSLNSNDLSLVRCEFNGPPGNYLLEGIPLESGQQITGLKLYFVEGKGTLVGLVRTKEGPLPVGIKCYVEPVFENNPDSIFGTETDDRGMFRFEGLPPGEVELHIQPFIPASSGTSKSVEFQEILQRVTLRPRQETRTEVVIDLVPERGKDSPDVPKP